MWFAETLHKYPELAIFLVVGLGYWFGALKIRGIADGPPDPRPVIES